MVNYLWSRTPGKFVDKTTGKHMTGASFTGTVREWYETLIEVMIDVQLSVLKEHGANHMRFVSWRCDPLLYPLVECSVLHKPCLNRPPGVIGSLDNSGFIVNIPVSAHEYLNDTATIQLMQFEDSEVQRVLGSVEILDAKIA